MYKVANSTLEMMKREEGFRATRYLDGSEFGAPKYSIGYGHQIQPGESIVEPISEQFATALLQSDLSKRLPNLNIVLPSGLTQNQFDQLMSYSMSFGLQRILEADLYKMIRELKPANEIAALWRSRYITVNGIPSAGLKARRERQIKAFFNDPFPPLSRAQKNIYIALYVAFVLLLLLLTYLLATK